jgi:hypothetical protein
MPLPNEALICVFTQKARMKNKLLQSDNQPVEHNRCIMEVCKPLCRV